MATTLTLIETFKIETRVNGDISYISARVMLDGAATNVSFRARVGEEPIIIGGDAITVSDSQVEAARAGKAHSDATRAAIEDKKAAALESEIAKLDARLDGMGASDDARAELHALYRANPDLLGPPPLMGAPTPAHKKFSADRKAIYIRHGLA